MIDFVGVVLRREIEEELQYLQKVLVGEEGGRVGDPRRFEIECKSRLEGHPDDFFEGTINLKSGTAAKCRTLKVATGHPLSKAVAATITS